LIDLHPMLTWLESWPISGAIRESAWLFPAFESAHVIAIALVVGSIFIVDLRLLGVTSKRKPVTELAGEVLPWTWGLFCLAVVTGGMMFASKAPSYFENTQFRLKMLCLALAGINMVVFHLFTYRSVHLWDRDRPTLLGAKIAGGTSLTLWVLVVAFGRWIGFTIQ
jgi:hypothetical protein